MYSAPAQVIAGQADYVDRIGPVWAPLVGGIVALAALGIRRWRAVLCIMATVFLLPGSVASVFHILRATRAIPLPVDVLSSVVSGTSVVTLVLLWRQYGRCSSSVQGRSRRLSRFA